MEAGRGGPGRGDGMEAAAGDPTRGGEMEAAAGCVGGGGGRLCWARGDKMGRLAPVERAAAGAGREAAAGAGRDGGGRRR
uniref:Uncharacterized protein n=1 Tax=Oryza sativa subsp. japonica TaxID=39947 RepID=Q5Z7P6_ORYSJ|nr:hypothetical protein [Oryza sativa Japonica Group]